jgi:hypothetical protein
MLKYVGEKFVAAVVAFALIALISIQVYWAKRTYKEAESVFDDKITKILSSVRDEANDAATCFTLYSKTYIDSNQGIFILKNGWHGEEIWDTNQKPDSLPCFSMCRRNTRIVRSTKFIKI